MDPCNRMARFRNESAIAEPSQTTQATRRGPRPAPAPGRTTTPKKTRSPRGIRSRSRTAVTSLARTSLATRLALQPAAQPASPSYIARSAREHARPAHRADRGDTRARVWGWGGGGQPARTPRPPPVRPVGSRRTSRRPLLWATSCPLIWACAAAVLRVRRSRAAAQQRGVSSRARARGDRARRTIWSACHMRFGLFGEAWGEAGLRIADGPDGNRQDEKFAEQIAEIRAVFPRPDAASCVQPRLARGADGRPHLARGADAGALDDADGRPPFERGADAGALRGPAHAQGGAPLGAQRVAARGAPVAGEHASREASKDGSTFALPGLACALARHRHHRHQVPSSVLVGTNIQSCYHWIHIPAPAEEQPDTVAIVFTRVDDLHLWRSSEERCARPSEPVITRVAPAGP